MSLIYLATPYTNFPGGLQAAFEAAARVTADLMRRGFVVYSPICHSHPVAGTGLLDAVDHELWMRIDRVMMDRCDMLAVAKLPTWDSSKGVAYEIEYFRSHGKPVCYLDVPGIRDAGEFTQPPNCGHPMAAEGLRMADEQPCNQPRRSESAWAVTWPSYVTRPCEKPTEPQTEYQALVGN